ncbi:MAG: 3-oxoacyl-[acyl-carrier-protein] reductase [Bacteroidales bacterium]|nr:3-oxoacyl-[acyl-carrier-protein] reductase [Bacteroidales bacterium]
MKLLEGKTAIITGASRGIGKAIALKFAAEGCNIAFTDLFDDENMKVTLKELNGFGIKANGYASDASKFDETNAVVNQIVNDFERVDVLVNNAGITKDTLLINMTEEQWDAVINVNLKSVFNFTKAALNVMLEQHAGSIINMSSVVGVSGNAGQANYSASKAGIIGFTKSVARELGSKGIRSNAIAPGFIITEMTAKIPEKYRKVWEASIPMKRGGLPEEVAGVALFLASDLSSYVSGQVIQVCGARNT